jgi:hypothetical protein
MPEELCGFDVAWVGACKQMRPCPKHAGTKCCSCCAPATRDCDHTGQFVCGAPLCDECDGRNGDASKGRGWGFTGHEHVTKSAAGARGE